jgi:TIR domain
MPQIYRNVFISYRHNYPWFPGRVYDNLTDHDYDVFLDIESLGAGIFSVRLAQNIKSRAHFLVVLTPSALEDIDKPGDWMRKEIEFALTTKRNVVPLMLESFNFTCADITDKLAKASLSHLADFNGIEVIPRYFKDAMNQLRSLYLEIPLDVVLDAPPVDDHGFVIQIQRKNERLFSLDTSSAESDLTALVFFEKGFTARDPAEKAHFYTEAISLRPNFVEAFVNRAEVRLAIGEELGAEQDRMQVRALNAERGQKAYLDMNETLAETAAHRNIFDKEGFVRAAKIDKGSSLLDDLEVDGIKFGGSGFKSGGGGFNPGGGGFTP